MKRKLSILSALVLVALMFCSVTLSVKAHPGRTDSRGGHKNHSTGEYHYHHGYSPHDHYDMDGDGIKDCPYDFKDKTDRSSNSDQDGKGDSISKKKSTSILGILGAIIAFGLYIFFMFILPLLMS